MLGAAGRRGKIDTITALVELTFYWMIQKANKIKCKIYNTLAGNKHKEGKLNRTGK